MYCSRCKLKMRSPQRTYHKLRKWVCPKCGRVRRSSGRYRRAGRAVKKGIRHGADAGAV